MTVPRRPARIALATVALAALALTACSNDAGVAGPPSEPPTEAPSETPTGPDDVPTQAPASIEVDWTDADAVLTLDNGWAVQRCEGDAPLLCVHDGDTVIGIVEAGSSPFGDEIAQILETDGLEAALAHHAAGYHETFSANRETGCVAGYEYVELPTETATLGGLPALRYGFSGRIDGVEVERNVSYVTIAGGQLKLITAVANAEDSCVYSDTMQEFSPTALVEFEPYLEAVAAGSELPVSTAFVDGTVVAIDGGLDGGLLYFVWGNEKERIQQPRAMTVEDVTSLGLTRGAAVVNLAAGGRDGSYFAVLPPDGPEARLYVVIDRTIHPVVVQDVDAEMVRAIPDAADSRITHLSRSS